MIRHVSLEMLSPSEAAFANSAREPFLFMAVFDMLPYVRILCKILLAIWACNTTALLVHSLSMVSYFVFYIAFLTTTITHEICCL